MTFVNVRIRYPHPGMDRRQGRTDTPLTALSAMEELLNELREANPEAMLADGLEEALIGYTINTHFNHVAVYSAEKCVEVLVRRDGMSHEEAEECLEFNTYCAYVGPHGPLYVRTHRCRS